MGDRLVRVPPLVLARYPQLQAVASAPAAPVVEATLFRLR
jgi:hypothetical protein